MSRSHRTLAAGTPLSTKIRMAIGTRGTLQTQTDATNDITLSRCGVTRNRRMVRNNARRPGARRARQPLVSLGAMTAVRVVALLLLTLGTLRCAAPEARVDDWSPTIQRIAPPTTADSAQPQLTVSSNGVLLSWIERKDDVATLKFAERTASGWTDPRVVASGRDWFVNWADVPSVLRLADGTLAGHWLQKSASDTYAYDVRLSFSKDDGRTWSASVTPHHDNTPTEHGFASLFQMPGAGLGLVWLDGRAMTGDAHASRGAMTARAAVFDPAGKQISESLVDSRVCECCPTTAVVTDDGPIAAFRDRSGDEIRDIHMSRLENGKWTDPRPIHADGWKIQACPVNGPMLAARGRDVAAAWFTAAGMEGRAFVAFSKDEGRTFGAPIRLDDSGSLGRVDIELLDDGSAVATYIEFADQRAQFRSRRAQSDGRRSPALTIAGITSNRTSGYPRIARHGDELVFAWTDSSEAAVKVQTAVARLLHTTFAF